MAPKPKDAVIPVDPTPSQEIELGKEYRDTVTGMTGIAVAKHIFLNGCIQASLEPRIEMDKPIPDKLPYHSFDESRLVLASTGERLKTEAKRGGPQRGSIPRS